MSSPELVLDVLRAELRAVGITYKALAERIGMSESSVKRMFGQKDMALSRLAQICTACGIALEDVLRRAADSRSAADTLTLVQEKSLVAQPQLLLVARELRRHRLQQGGAGVGRRRGRGGGPHQQGGEREQEERSGTVEHGSSLTARAPR